VFFKIVGQILDIETIASGKAIREQRRLRKVYGGRLWRKLKVRRRSSWLMYDVLCGSALVLGARRRHKRAQDQAHSGSPMKRNELRFVVCVKNKSYAASLELRKLYQVIADETAAKLRQIRVIDESGEDYLYPAEYFVPVQLPQSAEKAVRRAAGISS
jgi:hypothetical protein